MRNIWLAFFVVALFLAGCKEEKSDRRKEFEEQYHAQHKECEDRNVLVEVGGIEFSLPRKSIYMWQDHAGREYRKDNINWHPAEDCSIKRLDDVSVVGLGGFNIGECIPEKPGTCETTYQRFKHVIDKAANEGNLATLPSGIMVDEKNGIYILPLDQAPTADDELQAIECTAPLKNQNQFTTCGTYYIHPDGVVLSYKVKRIEKSVDELFENDRERRKLYESFKQSHKVKNSTEEVLP